MTRIGTTELAHITTSSGTAPTQQGSNADNGAGFANVIASALSETGAAMRNAEMVATQAMSGKASVQQVVEAVLDAERQLHTMLAVRDKVVAAYQELSRTSI